MTSLTDYLARLEELEKKATPLPWKVLKRPLFNDLFIIREEAHETESVAKFEVMRPASRSDQAGENCALSVSARNELSNLIQIIREMEGVLNSVSSDYYYDAQWTSAEHSAIKRRAKDCLTRVAKILEGGG